VRSAGLLAASSAEAVTACARVCGSCVGLQMSVQGGERGVQVPCGGWTVTVAGMTDQRHEGKVRVAGLGEVRP
jgi:hypothetical protein